MDEIRWAFSGGDLHVHAYRSHFTSSTAPRLFNIT